jgi:sialidase-1
MHSTNLTALITLATRAPDRKRLTVKMSYDEGWTWPVAKVLEEGPSGYSDLAMLPDGTILCFYECGIITRMCDDKYLTLAQFNLEWLADESKPGPGVPK